MSDFVLDASASAAWCLPDEISAETAALLESFDRGTRARVPALWMWEIASLLAVSVRRGRMTDADVGVAISLLTPLPIDIDAECASQSWGATLELAQRLGLSAYDASYLELAERSGLPLATKDKRLAAAAQAIGVVLVLAA